MSLLPAVPATAGRSGLTVLISRNNLSGAPGDLPSGKADMSSDGRWVVFESSATNLTAETDDNQVSDIFLADRDPDENQIVDDHPGLRPVITRVTPVDANGASTHPVITADAAFIAFETIASNILGGESLPPSGYSEIILWPRTLGPLNASATVVSNPCRPGAGCTIADGPAYDPAIARAALGASDASIPTVAFTSDATNLSPFDINDRSDVFVSNIEEGGTQIVSVDSNGLAADGISYQPAISADGSLVAFVSDATNLAAGDTHACPSLLDQNGVDTLSPGQAHPDPLTDRCPDVFLRDVTSGNTLLASRTKFGRPATGASQHPAFGGNALAFTSTAPDLLGPPVEGTNVYLADAGALANGSPNTGLQLVSIANDGVGGDLPSLQPDVSDSGTVVTFASDASNLVGTADDDADTNGVRDVYLRDVLGQFTERVSVDYRNRQVAAPSEAPAVSANGDSVVFRSTAKLSVDDAADGVLDVFARNRRQCTQRPDGSVSTTINDNERPETPDAVREVLGSVELQLHGAIATADRAIGQDLAGVISQTFALMDAGGTVDAVAAEVAAIGSALPQDLPEPAASTISAAFASADSALLVLAHEARSAQFGVEDLALSAHGTAADAAHHGLRMAGRSVPGLADSIDSSMSRPASVVHHANCTILVPVENGQIPTPSPPPLPSAASPPSP